MDNIIPALTYIRELVRHHIQTLVAGTSLFYWFEHNSFFFSEPQIFYRVNFSIEDTGMCVCGGGAGERKTERQRERPRKSECTLRSSVEIDRIGKTKGI